MPSKGFFFADSIGNTLVGGDRKTIDEGYLPHL